MEKLQHMARVMNLRKLKFLLFLRGSSADKPRVLSFILASWGLAWLSSSLVKVWTMVLETPAALGALSCALCVFGGGRRGREGTSWKVCQCLGVQFLFTTYVWHPSTAVLIQGSYPGLYCYLVFPWLWFLAIPRRRNVVKEQFHIRRVKDGFMKMLIACFCD